jgi:hypothetical protein
MICEKFSKDNPPEGLFDGFLAFNCQSCAVKISAIFKYKCNQVYTRMSSSVSLKGSNEYAS